MYALQKNIMPLESFHFRHPFTLMLAGPTQSGKTTIIQKIIGGKNKNTRPGLTDKGLAETSLINVMINTLLCWYWVSQFRSVLGPVLCSDAVAAIVANNDVKRCF